MFPIMHALILSPFSPHYLDKLRKSLHVTYESWMDRQRLYDPEDLANRLRIENICILIVESDFVFEEVFQEANSLKFVGICRSNSQHVDVDAASKHGIMVVNTPSRNARAVSEHALSLMLALARRIPEAHIYVRERRWENPVEPYTCMRGIEIAGRTLGIIGLGAIGSNLSKMSTALGMKVVAYDPYVTINHPDVTMVDLDQLVSHSDFISIHAAMKAGTKEIITARHLNLMKPTAYIVNTSDPSVVDQKALIESLTRRRIAGAAIDVFETHPISPTNPLLDLDNVVFTPHIGGATEETIDRHSHMMTKDILRFLEGKKPKHLVNPEVWEHHG